MSSYSKKQKIKEIERCFRDPVYFIKNYVKVAHPIHGEIDFKLYEFQEDLLRDLQNNRFNIILKARQLGISTLTSAFVLWMMMFHKNKNILVVATKVGTAANLIRKVQRMYETLPDWMVISPFVTKNKTEFELKNGSRIKAESTEKSSGRSEGVSLLVIDEAAHVENLGGDSGLWTAIYPTLSTGGGCIAISTPNGVGNWYHEKCMESMNGENEFHLTKLMWDVHPDRDQQWFDKEIKNMKPRQVAQELECSFLASGDTVVDPEKIMEIGSFLDQKNPETGLVNSEPLFRTNWDRNWWVWRTYEPGQTYLLTADVARGDGRDYSTAHILNLTTSEQVAEYRGKVTYDVFASLLESWGKDYGYPLLVVENNNLGSAVLNELQKLSYPNIYYSKRGSGEYVESHKAENNSNTSIIAGLTNSSAVRPQIVAKMEEYIREGKFLIRSQRLLEEMRTFIYTSSGKPEAQKGKNDDLIMAFAFACWVKEIAIDEDLTAVATTKAFLNFMGKSGKAGRVLNTSIYSSKKDHPGPGLIRGGKKNSEQAKALKKYSWLYN